MPDEPEPPRKLPGFKPREFEVVNPRSDAPHHTAPISIHGLFRQANSARPGAAPAAPPGKDNEVHALLRANVAQDAAHGFNELTPLPKRPSRRKRDYLFLVISGNLLLGLIALASGITSPIVFASAVGGMGLMTIGFTWVMWFVMDDY
jgi:hypothetical protein